MPELVAEGTPDELKKRYACDVLKLVADDIEQLIRRLNELNQSFEIKSNHIRVCLPDSMYGLQLLNNVKEYIRSFELVQGSMDDVFLNVTGKIL